MIPEVAILDVIPDKTAEFEVSFQKAQRIISSVNGWLGHHLPNTPESSKPLYFTSPMASWRRSVVEHYSIKFEK